MIDPPRSGDTGPYQTEEELRQLHQRWWRRALTRPVINTDCGLNQFYRHVPALARQWLGNEGLILEPEMLSPETYQPPPFVPGSGTPRRGRVAFNALVPYHRLSWLVGIMGCGLQVSTVSEVVWSVPYLPDDWYARPEQGFRPNRAWFDKLLEFNRYNVERFYPEACLPAPDLIARGPGDLLINMLGAERFYLELYDHPDEIKRLLERVVDLYIEWGQSQLEVLPRIAGGYCTQYGIWAPGTIIRTEEDNALNLSEAQYREFLFPSDQRVVAAFDYQIYHTHAGTNLNEWILDLDNLKSVEIQIDPSGPPLEKLIPKFARLGSRIPILISGILTEAEIESIIRAVPPGGLWLDVEVTPAGSEGRADYFFGAREAAAGA